MGKCDLESSVLNNDGTEFIFGRVMSPTFEIKLAIICNTLPFQDKKLAVLLSTESSIVSLMALINSVKSDLPSAEPHDSEDVVPSAEEGAVIEEETCQQTGLEDQTSDIIPGVAQDEETKDMEPAPAEEMTEEPKEEPEQMEVDSSEAPVQEHVPEQQLTENQVEETAPSLKSEEESPGDASSQPATNVDEVKEVMDDGIVLKEEDPVHDEALPTEEPVPEEVCESGSICVETPVSEEPVALETEQDSAPEPQTQQDSAHLEDQLTPTSPPSEEGSAQGSSISSEAHDTPSSGDASLINMASSLSGSSFVHVPSNEELDSYQVS